MSCLSSSSETLPGFSFLKPVLQHFVFSDAHAMKRVFKAKSVRACDRFNEYLFSFFS